MGAVVAHHLVSLSPAAAAAASPSLDILGARQSRHLTGEFGGDRPCHGRLLVFMLRPIDRVPQQRISPFIRVGRVEVHIILPVGEVLARESSSGDNSPLPFERRLLPLGSPVAAGCPGGDVPKARNRMPCHAPASYASPAEDARKLIDSVETVKIGKAEPHTTRAAVS